MVVNLPGHSFSYGLSHDNVWSKHSDVSMKIVDKEDVLNPKFNVVLSMYRQATY